jgi:hypothetical protein
LPITEEQFDEYARLLESDLRELIGLAFAHNKPITEAKIRIIATIMRRWLVDGDLQKLLTPLKSAALFNCQGNDRATDFVNTSGKIDYFLTAGVSLNGTPVTFIYDSPVDPSEINLSFTQEEYVALTLKKFLAQRRMFHAGRWFTTGEILRFVANKLGGNHLDFNRSGEWDLLDRANNYFKFGGPKLETPPHGSTLYMVFEPDSAEIIGGLHLEVLAAAASFAQMSINGEPLISLTFTSSLVNTIRKLLRRKPKYWLVDKYRPESV